MSNGSPGVATFWKYSESGIFLIVTSSPIFARFALTICAWVLPSVVAGRVENRLPAPRGAAGELSRPFQVGPLERVDVRVLEAGQARRQVLIGEIAGERPACAQQRLPVDGEVHRAAETLVVLEERAGSC